MSRCLNGNTFLLLTLRRALYMSVSDSPERHPRNGAAMKVTQHPHG